LTNFVLRLTKFVLRLTKFVLRLTKFVFRLTIFSSRFKDKRRQFDKIRFAFDKIRFAFDNSYFCQKVRLAIFSCQKLRLAIFRGKKRLFDNILVSQAPLGSLGPRFGFPWGSHWVPLGAPWLLGGPPWAAGVLLGSIGSLGASWPPWASQVPGTPHRPLGGPRFPKVPQGPEGLLVGALVSQRAPGVPMQGSNLKHASLWRNSIPVAQYRKQRFELKMVGGCTTKTQQKNIQNETPPNSSEQFRGGSRVHLFATEKSQNGTHGGAEVRPIWGPMGP